MAKLNTRPVFVDQTAEGAPAARLSPMAQLRRSVLSCFLWEREFYEDGEDIGARIYRLAQEVPPADLAALAIEARSVFNLRHAPLVLLSALAKTGRGAMVGDAIAATIQRADELAEFLAVHAKMNGVTPGAIKPTMSKQIKRGLALAFLKFNAYQLAKYDRAGAIRLRDALFLCHARPETPEREAMWKALINGTLPPTDTWEVALSGGADKRETFTRLLTEGKLGYLALLRNLRGMVDAGVDPDLMREAIIARRGAERVLPFRFVAAARACPQMEPALDTALIASVNLSSRFDGRTIILVDVSGSMNAPISARSDLSRMDAAAALASVFNGERRVFTFSNRVVEVPPRVGMSGVDAIIRSQPHSGTRMGAAVSAINEQFPHDRLIVITDEQSADRVPDPVAPRAYIINVASNRNGVGSGRWTRIDSFSEAVLRYVAEIERES